MSSFYREVFDFSQFPDCFMKKSLVKGIWNANEKARKMKKIFCFDICSCHYLRQNLSTSDLSFSQVTSVEKREPRKHFSASAYGLGFKNFFLGTLFSTSVTWEKLKSDVDKFCLRRGKNKYRNKILWSMCVTDKQTCVTDKQTNKKGFKNIFCLKSCSNSFFGTPWVMADP